MLACHLSVQMAPRWACCGWPTVSPAASPQSSCQCWSTLQSSVWSSWISLGSRRSCGSRRQQRRVWARHSCASEAVPRLQQAGKLQTCMQDEPVTPSPLASALLAQACLLLLRPPCSCCASCPAARPCNHRQSCSVTWLRTTGWFTGQTSSGRLSQVGRLAGLAPCWGHSERTNWGATAVAVGHHAPNTCSCNPTGVRCGTGCCRSALCAGISGTTLEAAAGADVWSLFQPVGDAEAALSDSLTAVFCKQSFGLTVTVGSGGNPSTPATGSYPAQGLLHIDFK
jgi:hypothetical protein